MRYHGCLKKLMCSGDGARSQFRTVCCGLRAAARQGERKNPEHVPEGDRGEDGVQDVLRELREAPDHLRAFSLFAPWGRNWSVYVT